MARKNRFEIELNNGSKDILKPSYIDCEYDSVHGKWVFYHKDMRFKQEYDDELVKSVKRI